MGDELVALGGAFLAAGVLARMGRRLGVPTIPFFMIAGVIFGPNTPGIALVDSAHGTDERLILVWAPVETIHRRVPVATTVRSPTGAHSTASCRPVTLSRPY